MTVERLAKDINKHCIEYRYFWAVGLIKETVELWRVGKYYNLLNKWAKIFADHYLKEG
jgi:hypothetical protein